jgi:hypothetical protein
MANSGDKLTALFRSLGPDDASFHVGVNASVQESEQRWPLFKAVSLARLESTPELSVQERQRWSKHEKSAVEETRKPALSLPALNDKLTISLGKIAEQAAVGAWQPTVSTEQARVHSGFMVGRRDEQPLASNHVSAPNITPTPIPQTPITPIPEFLRPPVVALNLEIEPCSLECTAALATDAMSDLPDMDHADDSLQSLFGRIQGKEKAAVKPAEKRSSFFDRLRKR